MYVKYKNANNAQSTLAAEIATAGAGSCVLKTWEGALFPATGSYFAVIEHLVATVVTKREIVKVTARSTDVLSITRSAGTCVQDDSADPKLAWTTAYTFEVGDRISMYFCEEDLADLKWAVETNASTTAAGRVEQATIAENMTRTETWATGANLFTSPKDNWVIEMTAWEDLDAWESVASYYWPTAIKIVRRFANSAPTSITGLDSSSTQRMIYTLNAWYSCVYVYKKSADNKIYAMIVDRANTVSKITTFNTPTVWTEYLVSNDALEANDWFCAYSDRFTWQKFIVSYKNASDDKAYIVVCTYSWDVITAWTPVKVYDTNIVESWTRPTCVTMWSSDWAIGLHDSVDDDPICISWTISGTVATVTQVRTVDTVTMNASWQVLVTINNSWVSVFYDDWTNIKMNIVSQNGSAVETPVSLYAWYVTWSAKALNLDNWQNDWYETYLFMSFAWYVRMSRVMTPNSWTMNDSYYISTMDSYLPTRTTNLTLFDVANAGDQDRNTTGWNGNAWDIAFISWVDYSSWYGFQLRVYQVGTNSLFVRRSEWLYVYDSSAPLWVSIANMNGWYYEPTLPVAYIWTTSAKLWHSCYFNNELRYAWVVKESVLSWATVKIQYSWVVYAPWIYAWDKMNVHDNWTLYYNGTKQVGIGIWNELWLLY